MVQIWKQYLTSITQGGTIGNFKVDKLGNYGLITAKTPEEIEEIENSEIFKTHKVWLATDKPKTVPVAKVPISQPVSVTDKYFTPEQINMITKLSPNSLKMWKYNLEELYKSDYPEQEEIKLPQIEETIEPDELVEEVEPKKISPKTLLNKKK